MEKKSRFTVMRELYLDKELNKDCDNFKTIISINNETGEYDVLNGEESLIIIGQDTKPDSDGNNYETSILSSCSLDFIVRTLMDEEFQQRVFSARVDALFNENPELGMSTMFELLMDEAGQILKGLDFIDKNTDPTEKV